MICNIKKVKIGENMRITITYDNITEDLIFIGEYKTKINNIVNWFEFENRKVNITGPKENKKFKDILIDIKNEMRRKVDVYETLLNTFKDIDEIDVTN